MAYQQFPDVVIRDQSEGALLQHGDCSPKASRIAGRPIVSPTRFVNFYTSFVELGQFRLMEG